MPFPPDAASAGTWTLGDLTVNRIGLGAMRLTGSAAFDLGTPSNRERSLTVLRRAVELGVNHIDTAAFYFSPLRSANELINTALARTPTTWSSPPRSARSGPLRQLAGAGHTGPTTRTGGGEPAPTRPRSPRRGQSASRGPGPGQRALRCAVPVARRRDDPPSGHFQRPAGEPGRGLGHRPGGVRAEPVQPRPPAPGHRGPGAGLSRARHRLRPVLRHCRRGNRVRCPGLRPGSDRAVARAHNATAAQVRLAWTLHQGPHLLAIPGTGNLTHLEQNVAPAPSTSRRRTWPSSPLEPDRAAACCDHVARWN